MKLVFLLGIDPVIVSCTPRWNGHVSKQISDEEYTRGLKFDAMLRDLKYKTVDRLHLAVSLRSFRSEQVSAFVKSLLDIDITTAQSLYSELRNKYPIVITRNLDTPAWYGQRLAVSEIRSTASSGECVFEFAVFGCKVVLPPRIGFSMIRMMYVHLIILRICTLVDFHGLELIGAYLPAILTLELRTEN